MIIYGWGYFNRHDCKFRRGQCPKCQRRGFLANYRARRYVTSYFIPVLPMGKVRVVDECTACRKGRIYSERAWKKAIRKEFEPAIEAFRNSPQNRQAALHALHATLQYDNQAAFTELAAKAKSDFSRDGEIMAVVAAGYSRFRLNAEAVEAISQTLDLTQDEDFRQFAEWHIQEAETSPPMPPNPFLQSAMVAIMPAALLALLLTLAFTVIASGPPNVYLVNGLETPMEVRVGQSVYQVRPDEPMRIQPKKWTFDVSPASALTRFPIFEVSIPSSFQERLFRRGTTVINPDRTAILFLEIAAYSTRADAEGSFSLHTGKAVHSFSRLDFHFEELPDEIQITSRETVAYRRGIHELREENAWEAFRLLVDHADTALGLRYLREHLRYFPESSSALGLFQIFADQKMLDEFFHGPRFTEGDPSVLKERPVLIETHRAYQNHTEEKGDITAMEKMYRDWQNREPECGAMAYLLGRISKDMAEAMRLFQLARRLPGDRGFGSYALAYHAFRTGEFEDAVAYLSEAVEADPSNRQFSAMHMDALEAAGHYARVLALLEPQRLAFPNDYHLNRRVAQLLIRAGAETEAEALIENLLLVYRDDYGLDEETLLENRFWLSLAMHEARGEFEAYLEAIQNRPETEFRLQTAMVRQDWSTALEILNGQPDNGEQHQDPKRNTLLVYALATLSGSSQAPLALEQALVILDNDFFALRRFADLLRTNQTPLNMHAFASISPDFMSVLYLTCAAHFPEHRNQFLEFAQRLNYQPTFHALLIRNQIEAFLR